MNEVGRILKGDRYIWGIYFTLCLISLVEIYSATSTLTFKIRDFFAPAIRHGLFLFAGTVIVVAMHNIHYRYFKAIPYVLIPLALVLLLYTMVFGETINGAQRVIRFLGFTVQPSEFAKLGVVTAVAFFLSRKQTDTGVESDTFKKVLWIVAPACLLIFPENFSTAFLLGAVCFCMMLIGRVELKKLFGLVGILAAFVVGVFLIAPLFPEGTPVIDRVQTWEHRFSNFSGEDAVPLYEQKTVDENYQVHHARMAIANGGVFGKFPGNSRERDFLPQAYSDFIYAIIIEEMGFVGGIFVMGLYLSLLMRAGTIAKKCTRTAPAFLIMGVTLMIVFQAIMHMAVSVGLMPVTGQPLPLISRGGTSTLITCFYFGIILSVSHFAVKEEDDYDGASFSKKPVENVNESEPVSGDETVAEEVSARPSSVPEEVKPIYGESE